MSGIPVSAAVTVCKHPLIQHHLRALRDKNTPNEAFRLALRRVATGVLLTATEHLPVANTLVETPLCKTSVQTLAPDVPIILSPILRAGLTLADIALDLLPDASVYHIGLYRNEETLKPVSYYNKLPSHIAYNVAQVFILDPMLATGGSAAAAVAMVKQLGVISQNLSVVCLIAAPEGIQSVVTQHPGIRIYTAAVDDGLNDKGYILPGLGDAGDRTFGTM